MGLSLFPDPPVGFHFSVVFELFPQQPNDFRFQEVSGLNISVEMEAYQEGGQNRFTHQLPIRTKYDNIIMKRGLFIGSGIILWVNEAIENFTFSPCNLLISLLNENHLPVYNWYVYNAIPKSWTVSNFNANENSIVVETLTLSYQYFKVLHASPAGMLGGAIAGAI